MFERFTDRARRVVVLAQEEARMLNHNYIGTEHILLGLVREGVGVAAQVLVKLGADLSAVRHEVMQLLSGYAGGPPTGTRMHPAAGPRARETPAAAKAGVEARRLAGSASVGSQHYLLGLLGAEDGMAARALAALGVSRVDVEAKLAELDPSGTSDETPEEAGARRVSMRVEGEQLVLEIDDPKLAAALEEVIFGRTPRAIKGTDADAAGFGGLWSAVSRTIEDLTRRLSRTGPGAAGPGPAPYWRPPALRGIGPAAGYWIVNSPAGPTGSLEVGPGTDRERARAWLADWLRDRRASLAPPGGTEEQSGAAVLWLAVDAAGEGFTVRSYGLGTTGPRGAERVGLEVLVDAAIEDLSAGT